MQLSEKRIEDLIYEFPWILDERFVIPKIKGSKGPGRQVNVGRNGYRRDIDLLFKDTRDNRPVIIELKKTKLEREHIAQILEYRSLIVSMNTDGDGAWVYEFRNNYHSPKMILIGTDASEEIEISANLAGIEVRLLEGIETIDLANFGEIKKKVKEWDSFRNSGNRTLTERDDWIRELFDKLKTFIDEFKLKDISTCNKLCETTDKTAYTGGFVFPFINFPIIFREDHFLGLYEYDNEKTPFSEKHFYCDFWICDRILDGVKDSEPDLVGKLQSEITDFLKKNKYEIEIYDEDDNWVPYTKIDKKILENDNDFKCIIKKLIEDGLIISKKFENYLK